MHGWRDFLLHLVTITIGLLIALSLEGIVEWQHHRHLVHEAEASLHAEIKSNADGMASTMASLHKNQAQLTRDIDVLKTLIATGHLPRHSSMTINFSIVTFDDVSWKTAQSTDALSYMPYDMAKEYAGIYATQDELQSAEQQAARDAIISLAPILDITDKDPDPTPAQGAVFKQNIETLQGQLLLVDTLLRSLDGQYKAFLSAHPH